MLPEDAFAALEPLDVVVAAAYAVVIVAVVAERAWLVARTGSARLGALATAAVMGAGALVVGVAVTAVERTLWPLVAGHAPTALASLAGSHVVVGFAVTFVAWDAAGFAHHSLGHRTAVGWASHQVHHTGDEFDLSLALRQSWFPVTAIVTFPLVALTGASFEMALACAALSNTWQALIHTAVPLPVPRWLAMVVMTPGTHLRHHRSRTPVNLGPVLTVWDRMAGTWVDARFPDPEVPPALGMPESGRRRNAVALEISGWRSLAVATYVRGFALRPLVGLDYEDSNRPHQRGQKLGCQSRSRPRIARD